MPQDLTCKHVSSCVIGLQISDLGSLAWGSPNSRAQMAPVSVFSRLALGLLRESGPGWRWVHPRKRMSQKAIKHKKLIKQQYTQTSTSKLRPFSSFPSHARPLEGGAADCLPEGLPGTNRPSQDVGRPPRDIQKALCPEPVGLPMKIYLLLKNRSCGRIWGVFFV